MKRQQQKEALQRRQTLKSQLTGRQGMAFGRSKIAEKKLLVTMEELTSPTTEDQKLKNFKTAFMKKFGFNSNKIESQKESEENDSLSNSEKQSTMRGSENI